MSDNEQTLDTNARQPSTPPPESATWGNMFLAIQKSLAETATLLTELRTERASKGGVSRGPATAASEEAQPPASEEDEAQPPASEEAHTPASEEAIESHLSELHRNDDDVISLFGGNDFDTDTDDLLQAIDESLRPSDSHGPQIKERVAQIVNEKFSSDIGIEKRKEIFEKYKTPENCAQLLVPKVNEPIWANLKNFHRQRDLRTAVLQDSIVRVCSALSVTIDELLKCKANKALPDYCAMATSMFHSIALLGHVNMELSYKRRDSLRPLLSHELKPACNRSNKPGKLLFGDDLTKTINDAKLHGKLIHSDSFSRQRVAPYPPPRRQNFLSRRGRGRYPPQQTYRPFRYQQPKNQSRQ